MSLLDSIKPFVDAGFALHWLHEKSKKPIGDNWQKQPVATHAALRRRHHASYNVGVRLGEFSRVAGGFLHVLDIDIRKVETAVVAWAKVRELFPDVVFTRLPSVISGSGGESRHIYFVVDRPFRSKKLAQSDGWTMVFDPEKGREVRKHDWEIELFGAPKQVAMPPSIHPDSGQPYYWERPFDFDAMDFGDVPTIPADALEAAGANTDPDDDFEANTDRLNLSEDEARDILAGLPLDYWCEDRDGWLKVGMALKHEFGEAGYDLWREFSRSSSKFDERGQRSSWKSFKGKWGAKGPVRMASLKAAADAAKQAGAEDGSDFDDLYDEARTDDFDALAAADDDEACFNKPDPSDNLPWTSYLDRSKDDGVIKGTLHNVELIVKNDPRLVGLPQLNLFTQETVQRTPPGRQANHRKNASKPARQLSGPVWKVDDRLNGAIWSSARDYAIRSILEAPGTQGGYGVKMTDRDLKAATVLAAWENCFHPVREYLAGLQWDGKARVEELFIRYLGASDNPYSRSIARMMMVAAVTRVFEPGHKFDFAVILEGLQGRGKSTFIRVLGKNWYSELEGDFHDGKEMVEKMQGSWIMEMPELSGFNRADVRSIKAFISRQSDKVRLAYEARACEFPRQCIFIGSTNDREYLKDDTGGRRFWPMECHVDSIDVAHLRLNVDQLWAEAYAIYGDMRAEQPHDELALYLVDDRAALIATRLQESRRVESADDATAGQIAAWLEKPIVSGSLDGDIDDSGQPCYRSETCLIQVWCECLGNDRRLYNQANAQMLGRSMRLVADWHLSMSRTRFEGYGLQRFYAKGGDFARHRRMGILE